jgi:hypothetical protein
MPQLTLDLPEESYNDALFFSPEERVRLIAAALSAARHVNFAISVGAEAGDDTVMTDAARRNKGRAAAEAYEALLDQWDSQPHTDDEPDLEALKIALNENRRANGERLLFADAHAAE